MTSPPNPAAPHFHRSLMFCVLNQQVCDGRYDCFDKSDEKNCKNYCNATHSFKCKDGKNCINQLEVCNGRKDCVDGSDEVNCTCSLETMKCKNGYAHGYKRNDYPHYCHEKAYVSIFPFIMSSSNF